MSYSYETGIVQAHLNPHMIGRLQGTLIEKQAPYVVLDVGGVGFEIETSLTTFSALPEIGKTITLYTHLLVREDNISLCGFWTAEERVLFRLLIRVNGIGPKLGLSILSGLSVEQFVRCIESRDARSLLRISGIGRKTAERLLLEMGDKLESLSLKMKSSETPVWTNLAVATGPYAQAIEALVTLGYRREEAHRALSQVNQADLTTEQLVRRALARQKLPIDL